MVPGPQRPAPRLPLRAKNVFAAEPEGTAWKGEQSLMATPPRKRAVPLEGVHARNVPNEANVKRARASHAADARAGPSAGADQRSTTLRIDRSARVSHEERYRREQQKAHSQRQWKAAFGRAFPRFVFYLDAMDDTTKRTYAAQIAQLGASVDDFFSRHVTHVVTTRPVPVARAADADADAAPAPATPAAPAAPQDAAASVPVHSDRNPLDDTAPALPASDLLCKAQHFGMKIWRAEKLQNILSLLLASDAPPEAEASRQGLGEMLLQEKLHGTTERDPLAMRTDVHYFSKQSYHLLVTDATGEHRPILCAEYDKTAHESAGKPAPWPVLHGEVEGRGLFVYIDARDRKRLAQQQAQQPARPVHTTLRRVASLQAPLMNLSPAAPGTPNLMASDNSFALASTAASTTSTHLTSQSMQSLATHADRRVLELHRRMHAPGDTKPDGAPGAAVQRMLGWPGERAASPLPRSRSTSRVGTRLAAAPRPREKKPGHCENCRCRYEDFDEHTRSRRHRKFAMDDTHFVGIDELVQRVQRPPAEAPPLWTDYTAPSLPEPRPIP